MSKNYLIKRNPNLGRSGVIVRRRNKNQGYSETVISADSRKPISAKCNENDTIYVAETKYGIYAKGKVVKVNDIIQFNTIEEIINFIDPDSKADPVYWLDIIRRFQRKKIQNPKTTLKFHSYFIDQTLLDRTRPLIGKLGRFGKPGPSNNFITLTNEEVEYIKNPKYNEVKTLETAIPSSLRLDLYSLFNKKYAVQHWIDIDHFVPKSTLGPGNIIENLVPVGLSLNRYKSNSVPNGLFRVAASYNELKQFVKDKFTKSEDFLKGKEYVDSATKINDFIRSNWNIDKAKRFYKRVLNKHFPEYVNIIKTFKMA